MPQFVEALNTGETKPVVLSVVGSSGRAGRKTNRDIFAEQYPSLRSYAAAMGPLDLDPDDLVQEALARTLQHHSLDELDNPRAYLRRAINHVASNRRRSLGRRRRAWARIGAVEDVSATYPSDLADLEHLEPLDRAILYLAEVEGRSMAFIGDELEMTENAVRLRASRARRKLRTIVDGDMS